MGKPEVSTDLWRDLFRQGQAAYNRGKSRHTNPYPSGSPQAQGWLAGWGYNWRQERKGRA